MNEQSEDTQQDLQVVTTDGIPRPFLILRNDVLLWRVGGPGEPKKVLLRLEKGRRVAVSWVSDDPRDRYPYQCFVEGWPDFFWLGNGPVVIVNPDGTESAL